MRWPAPSFSSDAVRNPEVLALARKVGVHEDPVMTAQLPLERPARAEIELQDGRILAAKVGVNRGDDALPYSCDELRTKFMDLAGHVWPAEHAGSVLHATLAPADGKCALTDWTRLLRRSPR